MNSLEANLMVPYPSFIRSFGSMKMAFRALLLTSNSLRHSRFVAECRKTFEVVGVVCQKKTNYYTKAKESSSIVTSHFARIRQYEEKYFSDNSESSFIEVDDINNVEVASRYKGQVDVVLLYGTSILKSCWLETYPTIVNLHLGLSPYYRGAATLFWPFYDGRLDLLGTTVHLASSVVDAGDILETVKLDSNLDGENYYDITTSLIKKSLECYPKIVERYLNNQIEPAKQDNNLTVRVSRKKDFNEEVLCQVLEKHFCEGS